MLVIPRDRAKGIRRLDNVESSSDEPFIRDDNEESSFKTDSDFDD